MSRVTSWLLIAILFAGSTARGDELLRWKLKKGQTLRYRATWTQSTASEVDGGQAEITTQEMVRETTLQVKDVDKAGVADVEKTIDRLIVTIKGGFEEGSFDSKTGMFEGRNPALGEIFRAQVGKPFRMKMSPQGVLSRIEPPDELRALFKGERPPQGSMGMPLDKYVAMLVATGTPSFPDDPLANGKSWVVSTQTPLTGPRGWLIINNTTYTYEGIKDGTARIGIGSKITYEPDGAMGGAAPTGTGMVRFDNAAGTLRDAQTTTKSQSTYTRREVIRKIRFETVSKTELIASDVNPEVKK